MDDFLHNLRSGKLRQPDRGRRDHADYKGPQRRVGNERRKPDYYAKVTSENFALVKNSLDLLTEHQKRIADAMAAREKTEARIADALETIVNMMERHGAERNIPPQQDAPADAQPDDVGMGGIVPAEVVEKHPDIDAGIDKRDDGNTSRILEIIASMRSEGISWEKIARHIDDQNIPTVSGKGKWRGQAIKKFWDTHS